MANIGKKALELISNLTDAGADPLEYKRYIGATIPGAALLEHYRDAPEDQ